jgi:transposase
MNQSYRSDLTDGQWEVIKTLIPQAKTGGRPRTVDMRGVINGIFYVLVAGCAWCLLPYDFPKWKTVYHFLNESLMGETPKTALVRYFRQWRIDGDWERIHEQLRKWARAIEDHHPSPSAAILDSQSVKTATMIHCEVGYDAAKQIIRSNRRGITGCWDTSTWNPYWWYS